MWAGTMSNQRGRSDSISSANRSTSKRGNTMVVMARRRGVRTAPCTPVKVARGIECSSRPPASSGGELVMRRVGPGGGHPAGQPGGARRVEDLGQVVGGQLHAERRAVPGGQVAARSHGQAVHPVGLRVGHHQAGAAVAQHVVDLARRVAGVDRHGGGTGPLRPDVAHREVVGLGVGAQQHHPVATLHAGGHQVARPPRWPGHPTRRRSTTCRRRSAPRCGRRSAPPGRPAPGGRTPARPWARCEPTEPDPARPCHHGHSHRRGSAPWTYRVC